MNIKDLRKLSGLRESEANFNYELNDRVRTPLGIGVITTDLGDAQQDHYFMVTFDLDDPEANHHGVAGKTYRFGSFQFHGHAK